MTLRQIGQLVLMSALWGVVFMLINFPNATHPRAPPLRHRGPGAGDRTGDGIAIMRPSLLFRLLDILTHGNRGR
jgi:hypothetical protein